MSEEVPKYTPKAKRGVVQSPYPPGWHPTTETTVPKSKADKPKPAMDKSKPAADKPKLTVDKIKVKERKENVKVDVVEEINEKLQDVTVSSNVDPTIELSKKLKKLRKRLRESEIIDEKIKAGDADVNSSQLEKSARRKEFEKEIEQLEAERLKLRQLNSKAT